MSFGFYGKMPGHGDFVRSRADVEFVAAWDGWLQAAISESRAMLGEAWQAAYNAAPIWRFALGQGVCGAAPVLGVMMPSQDRVGRMFPLAAFARIDRPAGPEALETAPLMPSLEDALLAALDPDRRKEDLRAALDAIALPDLPTGGQGSHWLSTFFGGAARRDTRRFPAMPPSARFTELLNPTGEDAHV